MDELSSLLRTSKDYLGKAALYAAQAHLHLKCNLAMGSNHGIIHVELLKMLL